jgi:D-alanyl-D-alanine carboxypeptidase
MDKLEAVRGSFRILALVGLLAAGPAAAVDGPSQIVIDVDRGTVLSHRLADQRWYPASLTKLMTAYVTFRALKAGQVTPTSAVRVSQHALAQPPSKMGFKVGTVMNVDNALKMMLVKSANDIAVAVAETIGGDEPRFVGLMNDNARRLGMASTHFANANGLPDDRQVTTARDMAVLARALWLEFPEYRDYFGIAAIKVGKRVLRTYNTLLERYRGTNGMKTGYICASGFNIAVSVTRGGRTLVAVVLGADSSSSRAETAAQLLNSGFRSWRGATGPMLASFAASAASGPVANLHDQMCGKRRAKSEEEADAEPVLAGVARPSALVPRFHVMDPVPVYTGRVSSPSTTVPMPRLRPPRPEESAATDSVSELPGGESALTGAAPLPLLQ